MCVIVFNCHENNNNNINIKYKLFYFYFVRFSEIHTINFNYLAKLICLCHLVFFKV